MTLEGWYQIYFTPSLDFITGGATWRTGTFFAIWPFTIDSGHDDEAWTYIKQVAVEMHALGATHTGVYNYYTDGRNGLATKIAELRALNLKFALLDDQRYKAPNGSALTLADNLPRLHGSTHANGLDLRFFDTTGWDFIPAGSDLLKNLVRLDPSYDGTVWQAHLSQLTSDLTTYGIGGTDAVLFDFEVWFTPHNWARTPTQWYNFGGTPAMVADSTRCGAAPTANPTADEDIAFSNYEYHWLNRGRDLTNTVHNAVPKAMVLHYGEPSEEYFALRDREPPRTENAFMPPGAGDFHNPSLYYMDDPVALEALLAEAGGYDNAIAYISFSYTNSTGYASIDPESTRACAVILRSYGFIGAAEWAGWGESIMNAVNAAEPGRFEDHPAFVAYYKEHLVAFLDGLNNG